MSIVYYITKCFSWLIKSLIIVGFLFQTIMASEHNEFVEGEHFKRIIMSADDDSALCKMITQYNSKKPKILIFFNYGCYGCWLFNKHFDDWSLTKKNQISVSYYPVVFNEIWEKLAKLYYINQQLQAQGYSTEEVFVQIHEKYKKLWVESEMVAFYAKKNVSKSKIINLYNSFDVARQTRNAIEISKKYHINVTPNIIINFKNNNYMVNLTMTKDIETIFKIIEHLIKFTP